ncbi:MAG: hypothetical protein QOJ55_526 [Solirubrobacteraceae bacterium]|nr:hypothetical protein [Solirubrobacteraceae bacterium]
MLKKTGAFARRNAIALAALFVALGGTSYAAFGVPINSVGSAQLRNGAIPSGKLTVGNKNYLRLGFGAPAAAILARPVLAGSQTVAPNTSPGQQLSGNNTQYNQTANTSDLVFGVTTVTVPTACTSASVDAYVGNLLVASAKVTQGNGGNAQTIGMRPEAGLNTGSTTAQNVILRAVNGCSGTMTVSALNLTVTGFK